MKLGVVGTSWITESFLKASAYVEGIQMIAVMSPRQVSVDKFMEQFGFSEGYTDYDAFIKKSDVDLVYLASPNSLHFSQTKRALEAKKHVICEKPITLSLKELEELEKIAIENDVFFIEAMRPVHHPHISIIKESLQKLDSIKYASFHFMRYSSKYNAYKKGENPRVFSKEYGGGALNDLGVYPITLAVLLFGNPIKVSTDSVLLESEVDALTRVTLHYGSFFVNCAFSKVSNGFLPNEIQGESQSLLLSHVTHLDHLELVGDDMHEVILNHHQQNDMRFEIDAICQIIENHDVNRFKQCLEITKTVTTICDEIRHQLKGV